MLMSIEVFLIPMTMVYADSFDVKEAEINKQQITFEMYKSKVEKESEVVEVAVEVEYPLTRDEIELIAQVTMAESEGEPEEAQRLVIDTILNRVDCEKFQDTVYEVIYAENQFSVMTNGRFERCYVQDKLVELVEEELLNRTNSDVLFFRASYYHGFGTPLVAYGNTYFSTY